MPESKRGGTGERNGFTTLRPSEIRTAEKQVGRRRPASVPSDRDSRNQNTGPPGLVVFSGTSYANRRDRARGLEAEGSRPSDWLDASRSHQHTATRRPSIGQTTPTKPRWELTAVADWSSTLKADQEHPTDAVSEDRILSENFPASIFIKTLTTTGINMTQLHRTIFHRERERAPATAAFILDPSIRATENHVSDPRS